MASITIPDVLSLKLTAAARVAGVTKHKLASDLLSVALRERRGPAERLTEEPRSSRPRQPDVDLDGDLRTFAAQAMRAARAATKKQKFGDDKVFISEVAKNLGVPDRDLERFKRRMVEAHVAGLLELSRADLVEAMDPRQVEESETRHGHTSGMYNFVRIRG